VKESLNFEKKTFPSPKNYNNKAGLFKTLWVFHSGEIAGFAGKLFVDLLGLIIIFLTLTGLIYWLFPKWIKRRKKKNKARESIKSVNHFSIRWHNKIGVWAMFFLTLSSLSGMFLRPPLLIAIANAKVDKIPFTVLDSPNPWYDKLRRILYDDEKQAFIVGTNEGNYLVQKSLQSPMELIPGQPPISVMGINVFEHAGNGNILVGSFNGLYLWNPAYRTHFNYLNPQAKVVLDLSGPPLSENMTAGYIFIDKKSEYVFDYNRGVESSANSIPFPKMPEEIIKASPMSLWNLALEIHTGRIYKLFLGDFYILFIPLSGITIILILVTGFILWWRKRKRQLSNS
jgi:membrane protein implicated in regulation of membrane protease activity